MASVNSSYKIRDLLYAVRRDVLERQESWNHLSPLATVENTEDRFSTRTLLVFDQW